MGDATARPLRVLLLLDDPSEAATHNLHGRLAGDPLYQLAAAQAPGAGGLTLRLSVNGVPPLLANELTHIVADDRDTLKRLAPSLARRYDPAQPDGPPLKRRPNDPDTQLLSTLWLAATLRAGRFQAAASFEMPQRAGPDRPDWGQDQRGGAEPQQQQEGQLQQQKPPGHHRQLAARALSAQAGRVGQPVVRQKVAAWRPNKPETRDRARRGKPCVVFGQCHLCRDLDAGASHPLVDPKESSTDFNARAPTCTPATGMENGRGGAK